MITPVLDRIFIRLNKDDAASSGGIILLDDYQQSQNIGIVESIGPLVNSVKKGDKILFHEFDDLPSHDPEVIVVRENSVLGVFEND